MLYIHHYNICTTTYWISIIDKLHQLFYPVHIIFTQFSELQSIHSWVMQW